jgi:hypothetical protein
MSAAILSRVDDGLLDYCAKHQRDLPFQYSTSRGEAVDRP